MGPRITRIDAKPAFAGLRHAKKKSFVYFPCFVGNEALGVGSWAFDVGRFLPYENRTSLPGSISKSRSRESSMFGLITSSMNFTKMESSRKIAYLSIDSKSMTMKNGYGNSGSIRFQHLMITTSGIVRCR